MFRNIRTNKLPLPLFFEELDKNITMQTFLIFLRFYTLWLREKLHKSNRGLPQGHNCQSFGHTKSYISHHPLCVMCGEDHSSEEWTKDHKFPAKYALCSGITRLLIKNEQHTNNS